MSEMSLVPDQAAGSGRLVSLDAFRGLTIAGMILVNNPGSWKFVYRPLSHAAWHGWTPTDLIFPSFLFIAGVSIPLALGKRLARGDSPRDLVAKILQRTLLIFCIGLFLNAFPFQRPLGIIRIPGVLQRIALCYCAAALVSLRASNRGLVAAIVGLLLGYWAVMVLVPVPGIGPSDLSRANNLAAWVDRMVMPGHLYKNDSAPYDPEGLLSTLPAIATALIGVLTGRWLMSARPISERVNSLFAAGLLLFVLGWCWDVAFPINKALWTSSFAVYCAGLSLQLLGVCTWLVDVLGWRRWTGPLVVFGTNPLATFVFAGTLARVLMMIKVARPGAEAVTLHRHIYKVFFASWADHTFGSLLFALAYVLFWLAIMSVFYRYKVFIRV
jgi:predicted acyltransferase